MSELRATYRLQLTPEFGFAQARALVPYLRDLGISHLYLSPSFQARPESTHGYDVIDPGRLSEALGGQADFDALAEEVRGAGMGIVLDVVPNHMGADDANRYWADPALREQYFDIDPVSGRHRRFFDIDDLAAVRIEDPEVFETMSSLPLRLVRDGLVDGLRVDHPDGLADPAQYLERLRAGGASRVWVEKILDPGEELRRDWPVSGTVGYEFLNDACALFVDPAAEATLSALWERVSGDGRGFGEWATEAKLEQARGPFTPEIERLGRLVPELGVDELGVAVSSLPVYRSYVRAADGAAGVAAEDRAALGGLADEVRERLLLERGASAEFVTRFQQTTPAIMAKGVEDTAFYRYGRLLALNDVGGDPSRFGIDVLQFHNGNLERARRFPEGLLTTMTHDAKRSGDVRLRIAVLSWLAEEWGPAVERWLALSERHRSPEGAPDDAERYFLFQTLVGAMPIEPERLDGYVEKALREAKRNSSWIEPNAGWEAGVIAFVRGLLGDEAFRADFDPFCARVAELGRRAALGQLVLKLTCPGVPDIYQGDELEFRALVDPDNRRPVDWAIRQALLRRLLGGGHLPDQPKLWVSARLLGLRARRPEPFLSGAYEPVEAGHDACAFLRGGEILTVVALRERAQGRLAGALGGTWREVLTGGDRSFAAGVPVAEIVGAHGVSVFERV